MLKKLTRNVEVRRSNGQCAYGPWLMVNDPDVPTWVEDMIGDEIAEHGLKEGQVERAGSRWLWHKF